ncbi:hypothetical protein ACJMK2_034747 [Sinanodonta woodiana]|uniref:Uncharacterized protein n=1 Tax=Sinanodonta woodiana TaxID=1069815 RepID=A0ABD3WU26_SINWO
MKHAYLDYIKSYKYFDKENIKLTFSYITPLATLSDNNAYLLIIDNEKMQSANKRRSQANVADDTLEVLRMMNEHPFVQTMVHNKDQVPSFICYTSDQITDMQHFLTYGNRQPVVKDRTFNLENVYVTAMVYKNQRVV